MQIQLENISSTESHLTVVAVEKEILASQKKVIEELSKNVKVDGFRTGKAPTHLVSKQLDPALVQEKFLQRFVPLAVERALSLKEIEPVVIPEVSVTKFVPGQTLEFKVVVWHLGKVQISDYAEIKEKLPEVKIEPAEVDDIIKKIRLDFANYKTVERPAKEGDRLQLDFEARDEDGRLIEGAQATDYSLILGSQTLIPGFEEKLVGQLPGDLTFSLCFPKKYPPHLADKKANFKVQLKKVEAVELPALDKDLFAKVGSFQTLPELRDFISQRLKEEKMVRARQIFEGQVVAQLAKASTIELPSKIVDQEVGRIKEEHQQALQDSQQTAESWLKNMNLTAEAHEKEIRQIAEERIKGGLVLRQVALDEKLEVTPQEVDAILSSQTGLGGKSQTSEKERQDIQAKMLTQKALGALADLVLQSQDRQSS